MLLLIHLELVLQRECKKCKGDGTVMMLFMWRSFYRTGGFIDEDVRAVYKMKNLNHVNVLGA